MGFSNIRFEAVKTFRPVETKDWYVRFAILNQKFDNPAQNRDELRTGLLMLSPNLIESMVKSKFAMSALKKLRRLLMFAFHDGTVHGAIHPHENPFQFAQ